LAILPIGGRVQLAVNGVGFHGNVRAKPRAPTPAETAQGPETGGVRSTRLRPSCLTKPTTYAISSWRVGNDDRTPGPGLRKYTAYLSPGLGGLPSALRLSEALGGACVDGELQTLE